MWFKLFDWLRLFERTAVYPVLLSEVMKDVGPYMLMMLIIFGFFGNGIFVFHSFLTFTGDKAMNSVDEDIGYGFTASVLSEILIMVGEFHYQDFSKVNMAF